MEFKIFITWLGLTVLIGVGSILMGFLSTLSLQGENLIDEGYESKTWTYGVAWVISTLLAGIACTYLMTNS